MGPGCISRTVGWTLTGVRICKNGEVLMAKEVFVGLDISKNQVDVHVLPDNQAFSCSRNQKGLRSLVKSPKEICPVLIVLEATGGYQNFVAAELGEAPLPFSVVNPARIRNFARAIGKLAKTDAIDAYVIARYAEAIKPQPQVLPSQEQTAMKELLARRRQLGKDEHSRKESPVNRVYRKTASPY